MTHIPSNPHNHPFSKKQARPLPNDGPRHVEQVRPGGRDTHGWQSILTLPVVLGDAIHVDREEVDHDITARWNRPRLLAGLAIQLRGNVRSEGGTRLGQNFTNGTVTSSVKEEGAAAERDQCEITEPVEPVKRFLVHGSVRHMDNPSFHFGVCRPPPCCRPG